MAEVNQFIPRLCHVKKRTDYSGFGFSMQLGEQDGRQHICLVKTDSPAEEAGLIEGDMLVEVNDVNVEEEAHAIVFQMIIDSGNEVYLLVVDTETDKFYKNQGVKVTGAMPGVKRMPSRTNISETNSNGFNGQQQTNPYHAGYDQDPTNEPPQQSNPYHVGYDPPNQDPTNQPQQQSNPYHVGYDPPNQDPTNEPQQQSNPYHVGYDPPNYEEAVGCPPSPKPLIQQPRPRTMNRPIIVVTDIPADLTIPACLICFCFCWCLGIMGIVYAGKSTEYFRQGDYQLGRRYRNKAITAMVATVVVGLGFGVVIYFVRLKAYELY